MIKGTHIQLRPICHDDWPLFEKWGQSRQALWGPFQRFQLDHLPSLHHAYLQTGLLTRESGFLLVETIKDRRAVGFVRYTSMTLPDADFPHPEIGFGITDVNARRKGLAKEAVGLLVRYLFAGYAAERISAFTDIENMPAQRLLETLGFQREGVMRKVSFRDGHWRDMVTYGLLRDNWTEEDTRQMNATP